MNTEADVLRLETCLNVPVMGLGTLVPPATTVSHSFKPLRCVSDTYSPDDDDDDDIQKELFNVNFVY